MLRAASSAADSASEAQRSAAYCQLLDICRAVEADEITTRRFVELMEELKTYINSRIRKFDDYPDLELPDYMTGLDKVTGALFRLQEACQTALRFQESRSLSYLREALSMGAEAEEELAQGSYALEQAQKEASQA